MSVRRYPLTLASPAVRKANDIRFANAGARGLAVLVGIVLSTFALALPPAHAQDPVSGALATLAAATVQTQYRQAAQVATRQAASTEATSTAQAIQAEATATAQAQAVKATDQAIEATKQALEAEATRTVRAAQTHATMQAQAARATETAYQQEQVVRARQGRVAHYAELFLYAALGLGFAVALLLCWRAYQALEAVEHSKSVSQPPQACQEADGQVVIEGEYRPADRRGLNVTVIDDPGAVERFEQFVMENSL